MVKRVLLCRVDGNFGGVERHILTLASRLDRERYIPILVTLGSPGELQKKAEALGIFSENIPMRGRFHLWSARGRLRCILRSHAIDVIHTFGIRSNTLVWLSRTGFNIPWIIRLPNINSTDYQKPVIARLAHFWNNILLRRADAVQLISTPLFHYISRIPFPPQRLYTIHNGIDVPEDLYRLDPAWLRKRYHLPDEAFITGSSGRLETVKGYDLLVRAVYPVMQKHPHVRLVLIGEGSQHQHLAELSASLNLARQVIFTGYTADIWRHLAGFQLYVCSSRSEGVSYAVLEAMAAGLPVIATQTGGITDIIRHGVDGILIPPNDENALTSVLLELIQRPQQAAELGRNAQERVQREFTAEQMAVRIQSLYDEVIQRKPHE